jgi:ubiquinone/menaquinone biosynthesis C-methylase UbiE
MQQTASATPTQGPPNREEYGLKDSSFQRSMVIRSAARQAAFFLPHLRPGMHLLDCGCGPGSITTDFAKLVAPGQVVGIDIQASEVERATAYATELGITNVQFRTGDIYNLPFADETFDAVFSNALLDHLSDPLAALRETYRVLKSGGVVAIRTADRDGYLISPTDAWIEKDMQRGEAWKAAQGVQVRIGKHIRRFLREAGFVRTEGSASYDSYGTPESVKRLGYGAADDSMKEKTGSVEDAELEAIAAAWRKWADSPDAFFGHALVEGVGWKE